MRSATRTLPTSRSDCRKHHAQRQRTGRNALSTQFLDQLDDLLGHKLVYVMVEAIIDAVDVF
jgi:hypothetical protein